MNRLAALAIAKGTEGLLAVPLWKAYGNASDVRHLWELFATQTELSQIGTIVCVVVIVGIFVSTIRWSIELVSTGLKSVFGQRRGSSPVQDAGGGTRMPPPNRRHAES